MSPSVQFSVWLPTAPVIARPVGPVAIDQSTPLPAGNGSLSVTDFAVPVPGAPEFDTVHAEADLVTRVHGVASASLTIDRSGASTTISADACTDGAFVAEAVAVFG